MKRQLVRISLAVTALLVAVPMLTADQASAGSELADPVIKVSRHPDGPFRGSVGATIPVGSQKSFFFRIRNSSDDSGFVTLHGDENEDGFRYRFFRGSKNVTEPVQAGTYQLTLQAERAKLIRMKVKHQSMPASTACAVLSNQVTASAGVKLNGDTCG